jgi:hyperosmotically inducible periplasmic protein
VPGARVLAALASAQGRRGPPFEVSAHLHHHCKEETMKLRTPLMSAIAIATLVIASGCAVTRGQETVGAYVDDTTITTQVKARMLEDPAVAGTSISVETLNGTVMLSGFAKSASEKSKAEALAWKVKGVKVVKNEIAVRP